MAKKSPTYKYPEEAIVNIETLGKEDRRYLLTVDFEESVEKRVLVILKNPSKATTAISDKTISNVTNYFVEHSSKLFKDYQGIEVLNIFPHYETDSSKLSELSDLVDDQNHQIIAQKVSESDFIILAYGDHPKGLKDLFDQEVIRLLNLLEGRKVYVMKKLSASGNPTHGQVWSNQYSLLRAKVEGSRIEIQWSVELNSILFNYDELNLGNVEKIRLNNTKECVSMASVFKHRMVFYYWWIWNNRVGSSFSLFTIDNHRDTKFQEDLNENFLPGSDEFKSKKACFEFTVNQLDVMNDSHIHAAMYRQLLNNCYVLCRPEKDDEEFFEVDEVVDFKGITKRIYSSTSFEKLIEVFKENDESKIYLDIDLDFFATLDPKVRKMPFRNVNVHNELLESFVEADTLKYLLPHTIAITIALHPDYCGSLFNSAQILNKIIPAIGEKSRFC